LPSSPFSFPSHSPPAKLWSRCVDHDSEVADLLGTAVAPSALVHRLRQGDTVALAMVYRLHHEAVRAFARRLVGDAEVAEDLVHDVFLAAPAAFRRYRGECALRTFLTSVAVNKARHYVRSASRRRKMLEKLAFEPAPRQVALADETWERRELAAELQRALDELPLEQRVVVILCEVEERTSGEVAAIVGAPEATVRTRLFHAKRKLRALLGDPS
jgi:RNA polymerase sigma-70 factor, ECF subfamily